MNQTYKEYIPGNLINFNGVQAPDGLVGNVTMQPAIGQHPIYLEWSENGQVKDGYALVAVYSDAERNQKCKSICIYSPSLTISP